MHFAKDIRLFRYGPEGKVVKNRIHLDLNVSGSRDDSQDVREQRVQQIARRLVKAGATIVQDWGDVVTMQDPEGNEFDLN